MNTTNISAPQKIMVERVVLFTVDGKAFPPFLCTPEALDELAVGHLIAQGWIASAKDIASVRADGLSVAVKTTHGVTEPPFVDARIAALRPVRAGEALSRPRHGFEESGAISGFREESFPLAEAVAMVQSLVQVKGHYGTHGLMLRAPSGTWIRQDIGRHNALDKVIGRAAMDGADFSRSAIAATGRISLEMLLKAATVGIPSIISKKYPSDTSRDLAEKLGIALIGNALAEVPTVYADIDGGADSENRAP